MNTPLFRVGLMLMVAFASGCGGQGQSPKQWTSPPAMRIDVNKEYQATIVTSLGDIEMRLHSREAPNTANNFVFLAREGFFDGVKFHRIIKDFMVQTGDPSGTGRGGPGYRIIDEPVTENYERGAVAMANSGRPNTGGSQFFIVQGENVSLPKTYTIFAKVTGGMEVVDQIAAVPVATSPSGEASVPLQDVTVRQVRIREK